MNPTIHPISDRFDSKVLTTLVDICQKCGVRGWPEALTYCKKCQLYPIHRYCFDVLPEKLHDYAVWFCEDCEPKEVPRVKIKVKFRKKRFSFSKRSKKKKVKWKRSDDIGSITKIAADVVQSSPPLQLPEVHCSDKNEDSRLESPGEPVLEEGAICGEVTANDMSKILEHNSHVAQPIVDPVWRGSLKFGNNTFHYVCAHISSLACSKVYEEAKMLPELLSVEISHRHDVWPKGFEKFGPTDQSIALYFFPEENRKAFDVVVNAMMCKDLAMRAVLKNAELLVFTSSMLPTEYRRFQMRYYLWGVFRGKQASQCRNNAASNEKDLADSLTCMLSPVSPLSNTSSLYSSSP